MLFSSINFFFFFLTFYFLYRKLSHKYQNYLLFFGGLFFYSYADYRFTPILLFTIVFNYFIGKKIYNYLGTKKSKNIFYFGLFINIFILCFFKYLLFFFTVLKDLNLTKLDYPKIFLPLGISFYTFHNISYIFDIYKAKILPTNSLLVYAIYDMFFPLLLAGPIERAEKLIPQIINPRNLLFSKTISGVLLFFFGLLKKKVVADQFGELVERALGMEVPVGFSLWLCFAMAIQVYADFSGYSDMARGLAKILGFELSLNFYHPYFSKNPVEFWKRWHISLSSWLRDYVYIPLGGNKNGLLMQNINLLFVWFLCGLWHGAGYGYVVWGIYCGLQVIIYHNTKKFIDYAQKKTKFIYNFSKFLQVCLNIFEFPLLATPLFIFSFGFGLLLFKLSSFEAFVKIFYNFFPLYWSNILFLKFIFYLLPLIFLEFYQIYFQDEDFEKLNFSSKLTFFGLFCLVLDLLLFSNPDSKEFFYFQF